MKQTSKILEGRKISIEQKNLKTIENNMRILEALSEEPRSFVELIDLMDSNKATIHRLLTTLEELGYVYKNGNNRFQLTLKLYSLGKKEMERNDLLKKAKPFLLKLVDEVKETVVISTFTRDTVYYLDKFEWHSALRIVVEPGKTAPLYCVASGKLYLAHFSEEELADYIDKTPLLPFTETTITNVNKLREEISIIRKLGYAIDNEEWELYLRGVAFPIYDYSHKMVAAISISGVSYRFSEEKITSIVDEVAQISNEISRLLGYEERIGEGSRK